MGVHDGHRARMKARFVRNGLDNFDDHSVLELLLFYAVPRRDVNELAHALLDHFGTLDAVFEASCEDMMRVPGVGENVATLLTLIPQVGRRYQMAKRRQQTILRSSEDAGNYLVPLYLYCYVRDPEELLTCLLYQEFLEMQDRLIIPHQRLV